MHESTRDCKDHSKSMYPLKGGEGRGRGRGTGKGDGEGGVPRKVYKNILGEGDFSKDVHTHM